uniref:MAM domain containing glycosylphosphatidylinositol anchor 2 n=1 Tax=Sarcophilus harrisii TaxID=9305 RepID=A0A7N4NT75_SARHA
MVSFKLSNKTASPSIKLLVDDPIVVNPGEAITLVCVTTGGEPTPTLTWVRSFGILPEKTVLNGGTLTIPAIISDDAGTYSCVANNNVGNPAKKSINIIVRALKKGRFWITPDPYHKDDTIQIGREVKISCQVEAIPSEELTFSWFKNGRPLRSSERMVITQTDPDVSPGTTNLDIIDLKFTDFGTYTCVASLKGGGISDISIDVNISSSTGEEKFQMGENMLGVCLHMSSLLKCQPVDLLICGEWSGLLGHLHLLSSSFINVKINMIGPFSSRMLLIDHWSKVDLSTFLFQHFAITTVERKGAVND